MNLLKILFFAFLFLLPIDSFDILFFYLGSLRVSVLDIIIINMFWLVLLQGAIHGLKISIFTRNILFYLFLASVFSFISFFYVSFERISYDLKISLNIIEFFILFFVTSIIINTHRLLVTSMKVFIVSITIISILTILRSIGVDIPGHDRTSTIQIEVFVLGTIGFIEGYLNFSCMILSGFPMLWANTFIDNIFARLVLILIFLAASIISFSRNLWITISLQIFIIFLFKYWVKRNIIVRLFTSIVLVGVAVFIAMYGQIIKDEVINLRPITVGQRLGGYFLGIKIVFSGIMNFLFGSGKGHFTYINDVGTVPHNVILDVIISKGIITFIFLFVLFYKITISLYNLSLNPNKDICKPAVLFLVSIIGFFVFGMGAPIFNAIQFWTMVSMIGSFISITYSSQTIRKIDWSL